MPEDELEPEPIHRRKAKSERLDVGDPVVLHATSRSKITFVPFFIPRSDGTQLSVKLTTEKRARAPMDWIIQEEKSITLNEPASRKLLKALHQHLAVAEE